MLKSIFKAFFLFCLPISMAAQPFECDGDFILALTEGVSSSTFYRLELDPEDASTVVFNQLPAPNAGTIVNAMGYRTTDNYIYGVHPENYELYRIDASGTATFLADLELSDLHIYFSGAITPDGKYLILLGNHKGFGGLNHIFAKVNLENYTVEYNVIPNFGEYIRCTDIAFNPLTGILYGFDGENQRLVTIDRWSGMVNTSVYPVTDVAKSIGALFFDAFETLYGYGSRPGADASDTFFKLNTETGEIKIEASGPDAAGKDGCACSNTVDLKKTVFPEITTPCSEVTYVFEIANATSDSLIGIDFLDVMPPEIIITEIVRNPYGGDVVSGVGSNVLSIEAMIVAQGIDSIIVRAEVVEGAKGVYNNQASLLNLPTSLGGETFSDDSRTLAADDSTVLQVVPLSVDLEKGTVGICEKEEVLLDASIFGRVNYEWDNGSTDPLRIVSEEGKYWISFSTLCETVYDTIVVIENSLDIDFGPDIAINLSDSVSLHPGGVSHGDVIYQWTDPLGNSISCRSCGDTYARPAFDVNYKLTAIDEFGCSDEDDINIRLQKELNIFVPNSFSPNADGKNDVFYVHSDNQATLRVFRVFGRWGSLIFEQKDAFVNDPAYGWDGTNNGEKMNNGVYAWFAELEYFDGERTVISGDVTIFQ